MRAELIQFQGEDIATVPGIFPLPGGRAFKATPDQLAVLALRGKKPSPPVPSYPPVRLTGLHTSPQLRPYQAEGTARIVSMLRAGGGAVLADDMGLGKTLQTCAVWDALNRPWPLIVVAPASTRRGWVSEFQKWLGVTAKLVETGKVAAAVRAEDGVIITSYELLSKIPRAVVPHMMVFDEMHRLRGRRAKRNAEYLERVKGVSYKLGLTGTPMWGRPRDMWFMLRVLFGYRFGTADAFDYAYCDASVNKWGGKENKGVSRPEELRERLRYVMVRRTKSELRDQLPAFTRQVKWMPAVPEAAKALQQFALSQIRLPDALKTTLNYKLAATVELVEELEGHAVVFTWMKAHAVELGQRIAEAGFEVAVITGDLSHAAREAAIAQMGQRKGCVVCTIDSTNAGVNGLQFVASTVIFHALDYTPTKMAQAESRLHRIGQGDPVNAVYLALENSADQLVIEKVVDKLDAWIQTMGRDETGEMTTAMSAPVGSDSDDAVLRELYAEFQTTSPAIETDDVETDGETDEGADES